MKVANQKLISKPSQIRWTNFYRITTTRKTKIKTKSKNCHRSI